MQLKNAVESCGWMMAVQHVEHVFLIRAPGNLIPTLRTKLKSSALRISHDQSFRFGLIADVQA